MASVFSAEFKAKLAAGKYTRWAVDLDEDTLRLVLWFVGEYTIRGGLHDNPSPHWRTRGASRVLCALKRATKMTFQEAVDLMESARDNE